VTDRWLACQQGRPLALAAPAQQLNQAELASPVGLSRTLPFMPPQVYDLTIELITDRFDHSGPLPPDSNGGNQLYGGDVAELLCNELEQHGMLGKLIEEDWGWLVTVHENSAPWIEICIYNWVDTDASPGNMWRLRASSYTKERRMYLFKKTVPVPNSDTLVSALRSIFQHPDFKVTFFGVSDDW
jgi:hypothetical protein